MKVKTYKEAWRQADKLFPTDYIYDSERSQKAGYTVYSSALKECNAWISELGDRLELNLPDGKVINIWVDQKYEYSETQIADALSVVSEAIDEIEDKVNHKLAKELGITDAREQLYATYDKVKDMLEACYPDSKLITAYSL